MDARLIIAVVALLLGSMLPHVASAQRPGQRPVRPAGQIGIASPRGETGRAGAGSSRTDPRGVSSDPRTRGTPPDGWGRDTGWNDRYPGGRHPHSPHHGALYGHHGLYVGAHFGSAFIILAVPVGYPTYLYTAPYSFHYSATGAKTFVQGNLGGMADALAVDKLANGILRLSWRPDGRAVTEVGLFLADAQQRVLAAQTLRAPPFSALFGSARGAAYVGITVAYADGQSATTLLPYTALP